MLGLSLRYKTADQLWFSFFHGVAHIVRHAARGYVDAIGDAEGGMDPLVTPKWAEGRYEWVDDDE